MEKERDHSGSHRRGTTLICQLISCSVPSISKNHTRGLGKKNSEALHKYAYSHTVVLLYILILCNIIPRSHLKHQARSFLGHSADWPYVSIILYLMCGVFSLLFFQISLKI